MTVTGLIEFLKRLPPDTEVLSGEIPNSHHEIPLTYELMYVNDDGQLRLG